MTNRSRVTASVAAVALGALAIRDYRVWRSLGPGGLPANAAGWAVTTVLRLAKGNTLATRTHAVHGAAVDLPPRGGPRPTLAPHPIPHRQVDQAPPRAMIERTLSTVSRVAHRGAGRLHLGRSLFERRGEALFATDLDSCPPWLRGSRGEIGRGRRVSSSCTV